MQLRGCGTALVTPFKQDGSVDLRAQRALVEWQIEQGIDFLVPCGTTGETPTLTHDEWLQVVQQTVEVANGRVPIVAGATSNNTAEAVARAKEVAALRGVDYILTASPYYNKPTQEGLVQHFKAIAKAVPLPIVVYSIQGRTGVNVEPATLKRLAEIDNIVGVKEASGNIGQMAAVLHLLPEKFTVLSGDDAITIPLIALGGRGVISVVANEIPAEFSKLTRLALAGDFAGARALQRQWFPLMEVNFCEVNPGPVKAAMGMMGLLDPVFRLPMVPPSDANRTKIEAVLESSGLLAAARSSHAD